VHPELKIGYVGAGSYLPATVLTNDDLATIVDTDDEWIVRRTGIRERRILAADESILDMAVGAARAAIADAGIDADEITDIRVGVNTWARFPSLATQVQAELGIDGCSAADVSAGCAGFVYAVEEAYNKLYVERKLYERTGTALVVGVDGLSHITDWQDRSTCVLLGDGAGAVIMREVEAGGILAIRTCAEGRHGQLLYCESALATQWTPPASGPDLPNTASGPDLPNTGPGQSPPEDGSAPFTHETEGVRPYLHMDGRKVYGVAVRTMVDDARKVIELFNRHSSSPIGIEDIGFVYPIPTVSRSSATRRPPRSPSGMSTPPRASKPPWLATTRSTWLSVPGSPPAPSCAKSGLLAEANDLRLGHLFEGEANALTAQPAALATAPKSRASAARRAVASDAVNTAACSP